MIDLERTGDVFVLRMVAGDNRIGPEFVRRFDAALDEVEGAGRVALVTTGEDRFYSNGLDIEGLSGLPGGAAAFMDDLHGLFGRLLGFGRPTVAALNGHAFAAGAMLAVAHDFRVMRADRGYFCLPEIDMATGQPLTAAMVELLSARLPAGALHELIVTGQRVGGADAERRKIVDEALEQDAVLPRAIERAAELAGKDGETLSALKRGLYKRALRVTSSRTNSSHRTS